MHVNINFFTCMHGVTEKAYIAKLIFKRDLGSYNNKLSLWLPAYTSHVTRLYYYSTLDYTSYYLLRTLIY